MKKILILLSACTLALSLHAQDLDQAMKAVEAEQYEKARTMLEKLVADNPADGQYNFHLGTLYLTLGEDAKAKACFDKGAAAEKNANLNFIGQGQMLLNDGHPAEAQAAFDKATVKLRKKDTQELIAIARAYIHTFNPDYAKAAEYAQRALTANPSSAQAYLTLGDAEYNQEHLNEAYSAYRNAFDLDNSLLRAKLHMAVLTKNARAFPEAIQALEEINSLNPAYGPAYREMAEVYYLWATLDKDVYAEYIPKALACYEKYMSLTDYSLDSRMRHADFLVLAKDYASLEREAAEMQKIDKVNPRILRYLGYSAYENGNYAEAARALTDFLKVVDPRRVLGIDYAYLARAEAKMVMGEQAAAIDTVKLRRMTCALAEAVGREAPIDSEFSELGVKLYKAREYGLASEVFGTLAASKKAGLIDRLYFANSVFYNAANMDSLAQVKYIPTMYRADSVYGLVIEGSPTTQDTYFNRARLNRYIPGTEAKVAGLFEQYIEVTNAKGEAELAKPITRNKLSEAYTSVAAFLSDSDPAKAIACFEKALEYEPGNEHAIQSLKFLKK